MKWLVFVISLVIVLSLIGLVATGALDGDSEQKQKMSRILAFQNNLRIARIEDGTNCMTYGIVEDSLANVSQIVDLRFEKLANWKMNKMAEFPPPPEEIRELEGREVYIVGFMYPLEKGEMIKSFKLMRSTQTCCWGEAPDYNQYILVVMKEPVRFERLKPVAVLGSFYPDCQPRAGYIYRMEGLECAPAVEEEKIEKVSDAVLTERGIPRLEWEEIEKLKPITDKIEYIKEWPQYFKKLEGKTVFIEGYLLGRRLPPAGSKAEKLIIGKYPAPEDAYVHNTIFVRPRTDQRVPEIWRKWTGVTGKLLLHPHPRLWQFSGLMVLDEAYIGLPPE